MIFLRFITEKWDIESALIRFGTRSWASHVEFVRTVSTSVGWGVALDTLGSRVKGGVAVRPYNYCKPAREEWYTAPDIDKAYERGLEFNGFGYDWWDILGIMLHVNWVKDRSFICSRFCFYANLRAWALDNAVPWLSTEQQSQLCTPDILLWSPHLKFVQRVV
jgi:hypothetical protein